MQRYDVEQEETESEKEGQGLACGCGSFDLKEDSNTRRRGKMVKCSNVKPETSINYKEMKLKDERMVWRAYSWNDLSP